ncbi:MAG: hypothetical protein FWC60_02350 [Firmicutes bacterium]|nr:hypothetical protein [Bacillota bacterium]
MKRIFKSLTLALILFWAGSLPVWAGETAPKPLAETFDRAIVAPFTIMIWG